MTGRLHIRNGKYCIILSYKDNAGKARQKWIQTDLPEKNNKRKAEQLLGQTVADFEKALQTEAREGRQDDAAGITVPELVREWLETVRGTVRTNSYLNYVKTADKHVIPYFEPLKLPVRELKPVHIQKYYNLKHGEGLSPSTIEKHRSVIRGALVYARDILEVIDNIPSDRAKLPKKEVTAPNFYTERELERLFQVVDGETVESAVRLCATYGFRRSEVLGLKWEVVDFLHKTITVRRSIIREGAKAVEKETLKKQASYRTMPLIPVMESYLESLREQQKKDKRLCGGSYQDSDYICRRIDGNLLEPNNVTFRFRTIVKQAISDKRLDKYIRFHDLRHSAASVLVNNGCTLKQVQAWLGHANIRSTERYAHLEYSALIEAGNIVNSVFDKAKRNSPGTAVQNL